MKVHLLCWKLGHDEERIIKMACGFVAIAHKDMAPRITTDTSKVTCKNCLKSHTYKEWVKEDGENETA